MVGRKIARARRGSGGTGGGGSRSASVASWTPQLPRGDEERRSEVFVGRNAKPAPYKNLTPEPSKRSCFLQRAPATERSDVVGLFAICSEAKRRAKQARAKSPHNRA